MADSRNVGLEAKRNNKKSPGGNNRMFSRRNERKIRSLAQQ